MITCHLLRRLSLWTTLWPQSMKYCNNPPMFLNHWDKLLLQQLWQKKLPWNDPLSSEHQQLWQTILHDLQQLYTISIPRCHWKNGSSTDAPKELHTFCYASITAYGAVAQFHQGNVTAFVIAKNRVAPLKQLTLPRLELMGATIAAQLFTLISSSVQCKIESIYKRCDS